MAAPFKREGEPPACKARVHWRQPPASTMAVEIQRRVEFSMIDMANVAYYPRIFDLAHKVFEQSWQEMCGITYPFLVNERRVGFPVVSSPPPFTLLCGTVMSSRHRCQSHRLAPPRWFGDTRFETKTTTSSGLRNKPRSVLTWTPWRSNPSRTI